MNQSQFEGDTHYPLSRADHPYENRSLEVQSSDLAIGINDRINGQIWPNFIMIKLLN